MPSESSSGETRRQGRKTGSKHARRLLVEAAWHLSAFRILQEALTNVVKHAGRARTTVLIGYRADALELTVTDSGDGTTAHELAPGGHGLIGMRERAALFGGTLSAGPRGEHGYEVHAVLPYGKGRGA